MHYKFNNYKLSHLYKFGMLNYTFYIHCSHLRMSSSGVAQYINSQIYISLIYMNYISCGLVQNILCTNNGISNIFLKYGLHNDLMNTENYFYKYYQSLDINNPMNIHCIIHFENICHNSANTINNKNISFYLEIYSFNNNF